MTSTKPKAGKTNRDSVWERPHIKKLVGQPLGAPIDLSEVTNEEKWQIIEEMAGDTPNGPTGEEYVHQIRPMIGESFMHRIEKVDAKRPA